MYVYIFSPCLRQQASFITAKKTKIKNKQTTPQKQNPKKPPPNSAIGTRLNKMVCRMWYNIAFQIILYLVI